MDNTTNTELIEKLYDGGGLCAEEYEQLIAAHTPQEAQLLYSYADALRDKYYGKDVYLRGLIEFSSYCKNDCIYCGLRRSNTKAQRYRLSQEDILECCRGGYELGYRTFVLQSGEDMHFTDDLPHSFRDKNGISRLRGHAFDRRKEPRKLSGVLRRGGGAVSSAPRNCRPSPLRQAPPARAFCREPPPMSIRPERYRLSGRHGFYGRLAVPNG